MGEKFQSLLSACKKITVGHVGTTSKHYAENGITFIRTQNVTSQGLDLTDVKYITPNFHQSIHKSRVEPGDVLLTRVVTDEMKSVIIPKDIGEANCANVILIRPADGLLSKYLQYLIAAPSSQNYLLGKRVGSAQQVVNTKILKEWLVDIPSVAEQKRIVATLDQAFADIDKARALTEQNLKNARELFESYLQQVFSQRGEGWEQKLLAEICTFTSGGTPSKKNDSYWVGNIPWVSGRDMKGTQLSDTTLHISQSAVDESSTRMAPEGSLLILVRGMGLAHGAQVLELLRPCAFNQDIRAIHVASGVVPRFLVLALRHRINNSNNVLSNAAHGTLKIDMDQLKSLEIMLPSAEEQSIIVAKIDELLASVDVVVSRYQAKLESLDELKRSLLHKAFSGELTNSSAEAAA